MLREGLRQILALEFPGAIFGEAGTYQETLARVDKEPLGRAGAGYFHARAKRPGRAAGDRGEQTGIAGVGSQQRAGRTNGVSGVARRRRRLSQQTGRAGGLGPGGEEGCRRRDYASAKLGEKLAADLAHPSTNALHEQLSDREFQVMQMLVAGKCVKEIAAELALSPKTISTFRTRLMGKLRLQSDVDLVRYTLENNLTESSVLPR